MTSPNAQASARGEWALQLCVRNTHADRKDDFSKASGYKIGSRTFMIDPTMDRVTVCLARR